MYTVIYPFVDLTDSGFLYNVGDAYPRADMHPSNARIEELLGNKNKLRRPLIKAVRPLFTAVDAEIKAETPKPTRKKRGKKNEND